MSKIILVLGGLLLLGCSTVDSAAKCKLEGWKGVVTTRNGDQYCSNGDRDAVGKWITKHGVVPKEVRGEVTSWYVRFADEELR